MWPVEFILRKYLKYTMIAQVLHNCQYHGIVKSYRLRKPAVKRISPTLSPTSHFALTHQPWTIVNNRYLISVNTLEATIYQPLPDNNPAPQLSPQQPLSEFTTPHLPLLCRHNPRPNNILNFIHPRQNAPSQPHNNFPRLLHIRSPHHRQKHRRREWNNEFVQCYRGFGPDC